VLKGVGIKDELAVEGNKVTVQENKERAVEDKVEYMISRSKNRTGYTSH
jgi:hypothetical protein